MEKCVGYVFSSGDAYDAFEIMASHHKELLEKYPNTPFYLTFVQCDEMSGIVFSLEPVEQEVATKYFEEGLRKDVIWLDADTVYQVKFWISEENRVAGESETWNVTANLDQAIEDAKHLVYNSDMASAEVVVEDTGFVMFYVGPDDEADGKIIEVHNPDTAKEE